MRLAHVLPLFLITFTAFAAEPLPVETEACVYGGTPSGVMAAVAAARLGHTVSLVDINAHTGGVVSGGLVATAMGDRKTVGGLADEFFLRIVRFYRDKVTASGVIGGNDEEVPTRRWMRFCRCRRNFKGAALRAGVRRQHFASGAPTRARR